MASWFETRGVAALLTMRVWHRTREEDLILRSAPQRASRRMKPRCQKMQNALD
jgi:hypothetical protein